VAVASKGPHVPATPATWYKTKFSELAAPRTPDYNASAEQLANHHWLIAQQGPITERQGQEIDELFRNRWRTLLSIDDAIAAMHDAIVDLGVDHKTYFFITSDHGYNLGQHRLPSCKLNVYDHDLRIPMIIKGPGITAGSVLSHPASNVDVGPTMLGLAGLDGYAVSPPMDGRSVVPLIVDPRHPSVSAVTRSHILRESERRAPNWRTHHFVEYYSLGNVVRTGHLVDDAKSNTYRALRYTSGGPVGSGNMLYAEFTALADWNFTNYNFVEVFDVEADPHQLTNLASKVPNSTKRALHDMLHAQWKCQGEHCENAVVGQVQFV
jgi:N-acetylglucosamine-6-sulfatase